MYIASELAAIIPMFIYLLLIWKFDRYDREPFGSLLKNFFWGAIGAIIITIIASGTLSNLFSLIITDIKSLNRIETILIAPFVEEITKGLFLFITVTSKKFDNITDGIVYGGAIGLGFGMTENFLYFISYSASFNDWVFIVLIRTLFSSVMHCMSTAAFGAFLGYAKFKGTFYKAVFPFLGLAVAMFIHFTWNFSVSSELTAGIGLMFILFTLILFISVFTASIASERKIIYQELLEEVDRGLIPFDHLFILNSSKRNGLGWVDENIRKLYIKAATKLAFRKMQLKNSTGSYKIFYAKDVEFYRNYIGNLLALRQASAPWIDHET